MKNGGSTIDMKPRDTDKGIRPGLLALVACVFVVLLAVVWLFERQPTPARQTAKPPAPGAVPADVSATAHADAGAADVIPPPPPPPKSLAEQGGIQVASVSLVSPGALELRYTVVAPDKLDSLPGAASAPWLVDEATGTKIRIGPPELASATPVHSRARSAALMMRDAGSFPPPPSRVVPGKVYSVLLPNPRGVIRSGSKVDLVLGDFRTGGLVVR